MFEEDYGYCGEEEDYDYWDDLYGMEQDFEYFAEHKFNAHLLTNLNKRDFHKTIQCIIEFDLYDNLFIEKAYMLNKTILEDHFGLYLRSNRDMSDFWQRFDELKGRNV